MQALDALERQRTVDGARGRPSLKTSSRVTALVALFERAIPQALTADLVGISRETLRTWENAADDFSWRLTRARERGVMRLHLRTLKGGRGSSFARWLLARRWPQEYGRRKAKRKRA